MRMLQRLGLGGAGPGQGLGWREGGVGSCSPPASALPHWQVAMSNWEARQLSPQQVQYAALDALICGHLYRGLRLWHVSPTACTACDQPLGTVRRKA